MEWVRLIEEPVRVRSYANIIYSNAPTKALGEDGHAYYIKGPERDVVCAEALGYALAELVGLAVPPARLCRVRGVDGIHFASCERRFRSVELLIGTSDVVNPEFLQLCILFDVWIANGDRNVNNLVAEPVGGAGGSAVELQAIDFEKAEVLRGIGPITLATRNPRSWWPREVLGNQLRGMAFPREQCARFTQLTRDAIEGVFERLAVAMDFARVPWEVSGCDHLVSRAQQIEKLSREAWHA